MMYGKPRCWWYHSGRRHLNGSSVCQTPGRRTGPKAEGARGAGSLCLGLMQGKAYHPASLEPSQESDAYFV
eukprot:scaffold27431_cov17-Tisochrysis_lutea.AAC.2